MAELRLRLSPRGDIVSEMGKQRTVELFGESLSPQQVVERICNDVERDGLFDLRPRLVSSGCGGGFSSATPAACRTRSAPTIP